MFTSKERSHLKSIAANLSPIAQVGKDGVNENLVKSLSDALEARELIKIHILETATDEPKALAQEIAEAVSGEVVIVMGRKAVLYRRSKRKDIDHIKY